MNTIQRTDFITRENAVRVGDLVALWGRPEVDRYSRSVYLHWRSLGIFALAPRGNEPFSQFLPVWKINFFKVAPDA